MDIKNQIKKDIYEVLNSFVEEDEIIIEKPKDLKLGDYAVPCFIFSKVMKKSPSEIAIYILENFNKSNYSNVEVIGGYINIFLKKDVIVKDLMHKITVERENYGNSNIGSDKTIVVEYSSPNIAKPFSVGHLRTTVIGESLKNICKKCGYKVFSLNYLGDYGTQFGKLIYSYKNWGNREDVIKNPIGELKKLYVKFHEEAEFDDSLNDEGRKWFKKLEEDDAEALELWAWFKDESLKDFNKTYDLLGINQFDSYDGEASYKNKTSEVIEKLDSKNLLVESEGATIIDLGELPPAIVKKSDGTSLYITRDLAAIMDRIIKYNFDEILYVVGNEQKLHFEQLKLILEKLNMPVYEKIKHINFGMILQDGKKMSTRKGKTVNLNDLLNESISLANQYIEEKNPSLENKVEVSKMVGIGAIIFNDLKNYRVNDIEFNLEDTLEFVGNTGPYIQYTNARIKSLLVNKSNIEVDFSLIEINDYVWNLIMDLYDFSEIIVKAKMNYDPSEVAKYLINLSGDFNKMYANEKFINEDVNKTEFYLNLSECVSIVLIEGMNLLGIKMPNKM